MQVPDEDVEQTAVDPNAEFVQDLLSELRERDVDDLNEHLGALLKSEVVSDRWEIRTLGSRSQRPLPAGHPREHKSVLQVDEYGIVLGIKSRSRWLERRGSAFAFLGTIVDSVDVIKAVILTRQRQVLPFLRPERDQGPYGFRISRVDGEKLTPDEERETRRIETMLLNGGDEEDSIKRQRLMRPELVDFVKLLTWDTLVYDACPIELTYTRAGKLSGWHNVDPKTVRLCCERGYQGDDEIRAVQVIDEQPEVVYGHRDLFYPVRNPRTDLHVGGYGYAEPEMVVRCLTHYLNAVTYNAAGLDRNAIPRGLLTLFGEYQQRNLENFKRQMKAMVQGAANRWTIPILASKSEKAGALWTPIDQNFQEMFFARWMTFLVSLVCAIYGVDPTEIHFDSFSTRPSSLSGSDTAEKLSLARDKGLVPLLAWLESVITRIVRLINPLYRFEIVGLHDEGEQAKQERLKLVSTVNEMREVDGKPPHPDPKLGHAPTNPALMQVYMLQLQQEMQQQMAQGQQLQAPGAGQPAPQAPTQQEDYDRNELGQHQPYKQNPWGGNDEVPPGDHLHTVEFGKAYPPGRHDDADFLVVIER